MLIGAVGAQQRPVADHIGNSGHPIAEAMHLVERRIGKDLARGSGNLEPVLDVAGSLIAG